MLGFVILFSSPILLSIGQFRVVASKGEGFLIVARELYVNSLDEYVQWKESLGFDVTVVTAEWILDNVEGEDLRFKIRNCLRNYYYTENVRYAMLVGDSVNLDFDSEAEEWQEPPTPVLSESWNLPAGYYRWDCWNTPQFTSLFYSDLSDKLHYDESECHYDGDFNIYVGIVPVRTPSELQTILLKTILSPYYTYTNFTYVVSEDLYGPGTEENIELIKTLAGSDVSVDCFVFGADSSSEEIHEKLFESKGVMMENGHGNHGIFRIGETIISNVDAANFQFINPLFIAKSCLVQAYHMSDRGEDVDCLDEAFLKAEKGPAVVMTGPPEGFWEDLFSGKSVGQALYDHCDGAWQNPIFLFGDPSLVVFGNPKVDTSPPEIIEVTQAPGIDKVTEADIVTISSKVVDYSSGVKQVFLNYTNGNGTWVNVPMDKVTGDVWNSTIPSFPYGTSVTYQILAEDHLENRVTTEGLGYETQYLVIPEAPWSILPILAVATLLIVINKRKLISRC